MDEDRKQKLKEIVDDLNRDVKMPPYNNTSKSGYSREYKEYRQEEEREMEKSRYERLCIWAGSVLNLSAGEGIHEKLSSPLKLLDWDITPGMVLSASIMVGFLSFMSWGFLFIVNSLFPVIPSSILLILGIIPFAAAIYTFYKPVYQARNKVIRSSGEMILSILYMVIYMRSSPNLEGAVRFAALNLEGPIAKDLRGVLWDLEVGKYSDIEESLSNYTKAWKGYNDDFLESLQLIQAAVNEANSERRNQLLQDSIDRILDGTREKMKHYAQSLKTPVMILNALGAMLPVLGMIMLPLISVFMGGAITEVHLFAVFNILLPGFLYWFMKRVLASRPPTVNSKPVSEETLPERGRYHFSLLGGEYSVSSRIIGFAIFALISFFGFAGYVAFPHVYPISESVRNQVTIPGLFSTGEGPAPLPMLYRSITITFGLGVGIGVSKVLGNKKRLEAEQHIENIEKQFPTALFQLGNKISGGTPPEVALEQAAESTSDLEISELFDYASRNIREMGMTFEDAIFDPEYGALKEFPSQMIHTVMKAILESSEKGTKMASMAMMTISKYLDNIHETQETLNDLLEETTTTIQMLAYLLAPVVSGVAVGMSQTIITAMYQLGQSFSQTGAQLPQTGGAGSPGFSGIIGNLDTAIPPEVLQFVVGIYLIQLLFILGQFYMKIRHGENITYRNMFIGKILIVGMVFYTITLVTVSLLFGGIVSGIAS
ncbi:MAG: type II secretion system F family protein [Candidatus Nanohaloarchaea archaeon]